MRTFLLYYLVCLGLFSELSQANEFSCLAMDGRVHGLKGPNESPLTPAKIKEVIDFFNSFDLEMMSEPTDSFPTQVKKIVAMFPETNRLFSELHPYAEIFDEAGEPSNVIGLVLMIKHFSFTYKYNQENTLVRKGTGSLITHRIWTTIQAMKRNGALPVNIPDRCSWLMNAVIANDPYFPLSVLKNDIDGYLHRQTDPDFIAKSEDAPLIEAINNNLRVF